MSNKSNYLIALPCFPKAKGFCHRTILVSATSEIDAISIAKRLKPNDNIGDVKKVNY